MSSPLNRWGQIWRGGERTTAPPRQKVASVGMHLSIVPSAMLRFMPCQHPSCRQSCKPLQVELPWWKVHKAGDHRVGN